MIQETLLYYYAIVIRLMQGLQTVRARVGYILVSMQAGLHLHGPTVSYQQLSGVQEGKETAYTRVGVGY